MTHMLQNPEAYFKKFVHPRNELLAALEAEAEREEIPIVGPLVGELLSILTRVTRATSILELGTATGYSAIYLAANCDSSNGRVITLEQDPEMAARAMANIHNAGLDDR